MNHSYNCYSTADKPDATKILLMNVLEQLLAAGPTLTYLSETSHLRRITLKLEFNYLIFKSMEYH